VALAAVATVGWSSGAEATLLLRASFDGGGTVSAIDNDLTATCASPIVGPCQVPDTNPTLGILALAGDSAAGGDLLVDFNVHTQSIASGPGALNLLNSAGISITNVGAISHAFQFAVGATDFEGPVSTATVSGEGEWSHLGGGYSGSSITQRWFNDPDNRQGGLVPGPIQPGILLDLNTEVPAPNPDPYSHDGGPFAVLDPALFSMTIQFEGVIGPGVSLTGRQQTILKPQDAAVPMPATLLLLGSAVALLGWRRFGA
jgi:hypothetical protein